jgi:hypothetical protein
MTAALDLMAGELVAVCEDADGSTGGVQVIEDEADAEVACSPGLALDTPPPGGSGEPAPSGRVVRVVRLP